MASQSDEAAADGAARSGDRYRTAGIERLYAREGATGRWCHAPPILFSTDAPTCDACGSAVLWEGEPRRVEDGLWLYAVLCACGPDELLAPLRLCKGGTRAFWHASWTDAPSTTIGPRDPDNEEDEEMARGAKKRSAAAVSEDLEGEAPRLAHPELDGGEGVDPSSGLVSPAEPGSSPPYPPASAGELADGLPAWDLSTAVEGPLKVAPTVVVLVADLVEADYNPEVMTDAEVEALDDSIDGFGLVEDLVLNFHPERRNVVVGGHNRLRHARKRGQVSLPAKAVYLDLAGERELNARLNANRGRFDHKLLAGGGYERQDLASWGLSPSDLAGFDRAIEEFRENEPPPNDHVQWAGMPDFDHQDLQSWGAVKVHFRNAADRDGFAELVGQKITEATKALWFPPAEIGHYADKRYRTLNPVNPRYPVYVISKGRWKSRPTSRALEAMGVPYRIVVEPQEFEDYASVIDPAKILQLPFSNLGQGSIPARNWVWDHSLEAGDERHWILDDNILGFYRFQANLKAPVRTGATFRAIEDFTERYDNVPISGMNYFMFVTRKSGNIPPFVLNTRVYSCILIQNSLRHRWRGRYNEDTDLSLRTLKSGLCTILFNAFLAEKPPTMTMKGGNTDELYQGDGRLQMAESLQDQHPDVVTVVRKWDRWQHQVNYKPFKGNRLVLREGVEIPGEPDNYGMWLEVDGNAAHSQNPDSEAELLRESQDEPEGDGWDGEAPGD